MHFCGEVDVLIKITDFTSNYKASHWVLIKQDIICWVIVNNIIIIMATTVGFKTSQLNFDAQDLKRQVC